jgi:hypothetical protein
MIGEGFPKIPAYADTGSGTVDQGIFITLSIILIVAPVEVE